MLQNPATTEIQIPPQILENPKDCPSSSGNMEKSTSPIHDSTTNGASKDDDVINMTIDEYIEDNPDHSSPVAQPDLN